MRFKSLLLATTALATGLAGPLLADETKKKDEIVITATPLDRSSTEIALPVTVVERDQIVREGANSLGDLLARQPGIAESSFAAGASRPIIRGLDNFRVRVQENGIGTHDASALSEDHGVPIDPLSVQRVEIIRGPAVLRYGSEAIGGVVNVLNNRIPDSRPENAVSAEMQVMHSTADEGIEGSVLADVAHDNLVVHFDAFRRDAEDYDIPRTPESQADTFLESTGVSGGASYLFENGYVGGSVTFFESDYGIPAAEERLKIDLEQTRYQFAGGINNIDSIISEVKLSGGYTDYTHDEVEIESRAVGSTFDNEEFEGRLELLHKPINGLEGAIGFQFRDRDLAASGEGGELLSPSDTTAYGFFIFEELAITNWLTAQVGGRVDKVKIEGTGFLPVLPDGFEFPAERDFTPISGSVGFVINTPHNLSVGLTGQYVERAPDVLELFAKGPHEATETFEIGNPNLEEEAAWSAEFTVKRTEGPFTFDFAAFYTSYDGFIFKNFTGVSCGEEFDTCGTEDELTQIRYSQEDADFYGFELGTKWEAMEVHDGVLGVDAQFDYVRAELDSSGNVPRIPPMRYGAGVFFESERWFGRVGALRVGQQDEVAQFETATKGYVRLDADLIHTLPLANTNATIDLGVTADNLLDEDARNHVSFKKTEVLLPGRNVKLFARFKF